MSFPRYPKYKDSGVEWLGEVPEHWEVKSIRRVIAAPLSNGIFKKKEAFGEGVLLVNVFDIYRPDFKVDFDALDRVRCDPSETSAYEVSSGDLFFVRSSLKQEGIAVVAMADACAEPAVFECHLIRARPNRQVLDGRFGSYVLNSVVYRSMMVANAKITTMTTIDQEAILSTLLPIPPTSEQTQIATFLDRETAKIDELVGEQRRLIELLKEKRHAVISHAVTKGLNPSAPMKPSGIEWLGEVPESWAVMKLGRAVFMQEGPGLRNWQFTDEGTRVICVTNITEAGIDFSRLEKFISTEEYNSGYKHFTVRSGDVLLSSSGNSWGKVAIYEGDEEVILNTSTIRLNESEDAPLNRDYIAILLQSVAIREQLGLAMTGSCQPNFGPTHLNCVMVAIPSRAEQIAIVAFINTEIAKLDILIAEAQRAIDLLQERRTALISAAVTGQIDVRPCAERKSA